MMTLLDPYSFMGNDLGCSEKNPKYVLINRVDLLHYEVLVASRANTVLEATVDDPLQINCWGTTCLR